MLVLCCDLCGKRKFPDEMRNIPFTLTQSRVSATGTTTASRTEQVDICSRCARQIAWHVEEYARKELKLTTNETRAMGLYRTQKFRAFEIAQALPYFQTALDWNWSYYRYRRWRGWWQFDANKSIADKCTGGV